MSRATCFACFVAAARMWTSTGRPTSSATIRAALTSGRRQSSRSSSVRSSSMIQERTGFALSVVRTVFVSHVVMANDNGVSSQTDRDEMVRAVYSLEPVHPRTINKNEKSVRTDGFPGTHAEPDSIGTVEKGRGEMERRARRATDVDYIKAADAARILHV